MVWIFLIGLLVFWIDMAFVWARLGFMKEDKEILKEHRDKNATGSKRY